MVVSGVYAKASRLGASYRKPFRDPFMEVDTEWSSLEIALTRLMVTVEFDVLVTLVDSGAMIFGVPQKRPLRTVSGTNRNGPARVVAASKRARRLILCIRCFRSSEKEALFGGRESAKPMAQCNSIEIEPGSRSIPGAPDGRAVLPSAEKRRAGVCDKSCLPEGMTSPIPFDQLLAKVCRVS